MIATLAQQPRAVRMNNRKERKRGRNFDNKVQGSRTSESKRRAKCNPNSEGITQALIASMRMMQLKLPKLKADSAENYWVFRRQFQVLFLETSVPAMLKLNKLYTTCDWEIQKLISHCMVLPAEKGLDAALTILDKRIGDMCMDQSRGKLIRGPEMGEHDYQAFSAICAQLMPFILFAENIGKLSEIDNRPTIRDIILRLDDAMQGRWDAYRAGKKVNALHI